MSGPGQPVPDELLLAGLIEANRDHQPGPAGPAISDHPDDHVEWLHAALSAVLPAHEAMVWEHIAAEVSIQAGGDELMKWWEAVIEHRVRAKVAEELRTQGSLIFGMCACGTDAIERTIALWETR